MRGMLEHSSDSSLTIIFGSISTDEGTTREGDVPTELSRDDCTGWKAGGLENSNL